MTAYHEYTGHGTISEITDVEFTVAIPVGATDKEARALMKAAIENAAHAGAGTVEREIMPHNFSRGARLDRVEPE